jgi:ethanolamine transporter EutH
MDANRHKYRYLQRLKRLGFDFIFLAGSLALILIAALIIVWPLWYLATRLLPLYTWLCLALIVGGFLSLIAGRIKARRQHESI